MPVAVDVGGTFTDVVAWTEEGLRTTKVPTTPDQSESVLGGVDAVSAVEETLLHGTTAATNAVLQRSGARTALITDAGFGDLLEIGRQDRPSLYDSKRVRTLPLVPSELRFGLAGRDGHTGDGPPIEQDDLEQLVAEVESSGAEAVAVSLLFSFADSAREASVGDALARALPGVPVSLSSRLVPEAREFERSATTVLNAYLIPVVAGYLERLAHRHRGGEPRVMRSSGGLASLEQAAREPASIVLSGPAGGVVAAASLGAAIGRSRIVSFDMGGTSTDVCRIEDGRPTVSYAREIDGLPSLMPSVAIHTVGAGGGSIAWADPGGALRVGPQSAGADPGPASYGRGGLAPTVTDADLAVGRLGVDTTLGGSLGLDPGAAAAAIARLAGELGMDATACALGIIEVVEAHMERAVRRVSVDEGFDPRGATLVAFGGAGGLHASALARRLDMASVLVPAHAGVFSALGLLLAPPRFDASQGVILDGTEGLAALARSVARVAADGLLGSGSELDAIDVSVDIRYLGQAHETNVPYRDGEPPDAVITRFHDAHERRNGFSRRDAPVEVVTVRAEAVGAPVMNWAELPVHVAEGDAERGSRTVVGPGVEYDASVWWRPALAPGHEVSGPAVIEEPEATTFVGEGERASVLDSGALEITWS